MASSTTAAKCRLVDGKVVGTIKGLHYSEDIWKATTSEQKVQVLSPVKEKKPKVKYQQKYHDTLCEEQALYQF